MSPLSLINRTSELFTSDISKHETQLSETVSASRFLVIGGAGSIGRPICSRDARPCVSTVANIIELVRDIRSSFGYIAGDFQTFALDVGSVAYDAFWEAGGEYDYVLNLSALKHVRSEKDPYTQMRMIEVNNIKH